MQLSALLHRAHGAMAYPVDTDHLRVVLQSARGDLTAADCHFGDRYTDPSRDQVLPMALAAGDRLHDYWVVTLPVPTRRVRYRFFLRGRRGTAWFGEHGPGKQSAACPWFHYPYMAPGDSFRLPSWLPGAVIYQVFPDRFYNGDPGNDPPDVRPWGELPTWYSSHGGDLRGIAQKLDWLSALSAGCLYMTPIFASPSPHKYNTTDYYRVDPAFGTLEDLQALVAAAHGAGIRVVLDGVFNHAGSDFFAFQDAVQSGEGSQYRHWFNIRSFPVQVGQGCNYETWADDVITMPKLMTHQPEVREYLLGVAEHWLRTAGIDGWRLDVANEVGRDFWRAFRQRVRTANADALILGEVWHDATAFLQGDTFDSVTDYQWREAVLALLTGKLAPDAFDQVLTRMRFQYPGAAVGGLVRLLGSHDTPRVRTVVGSVAKVALGAILLFTSQGVPMVYYGDEIGMEGGWDPDCRRCMAWSGEAQDQELLRLFRQLGRLRRALPWLNTGEWTTLVANRDSGVYAYRRDSRLAANAAPAGMPLPAADGESIWVVLNLSSETRGVTLPIGAAETPAPADLLGRCRRIATETEGGLRVEVGPHDGTILGNAEVAQRLFQ